MNLENKPCSELHIDAIRRELDLKMRSKKTFKNEVLRMPNGFFRTEKSFPKFWQLIEEPTVTDANVKPESPDERFKSLLRQHADPGQGEDFIERVFQQYKRIQKMLELERSQDEDFIESAFQEYKRIQKMLELKRSEAVSDIGVDENLTDNKLNVVPGMDVAEKKSKEGSITMRDAWLSNSDKSSQGRTRITTNLENKPCSELHIDAIRRELDLKMRSKKTFKNEGLRMPIGIFKTKTSTSKFWQVEEPPVTDANVKPESPDERLKSLSRRCADPGQGEDFIERAFQEYKRIQKMLELKHSQVVHDVHMDESRANKRKAVAESVMDENFNGVTYKSRKL